MLSCWHPSPLPVPFPSAVWGWKGPFFKCTFPSEMDFWAGGNSCLLTGRRGGWAWRAWPLCLHQQAPAGGRSGVLYCWTCTCWREWESWVLLPLDPDTYPELTLPLRWQCLSLDKDASKWDAFSWCLKYRSSISFKFEECSMFSGIYHFDFSVSFFFL